MKRKLRVGGVICCVVLVALYVAFGRSKNKRTPPPAITPEVGVVQVQQKDVPIYSEWIGTLDGMVNAEIKAQVSGYLLRTDYTEGSFVNRGALLFEIDPRPFQAAVDQARGEVAKAQGQLAQANSQLSQAKAQVVQAEANQRKTQLDVDRYTPLAKEKAITAEQLDNAIQANIAAKAQVEAAAAGVDTANAAIVAANASVESAKAAVQTAELNLSFTRITSLIDGIAGLAQAQVGNLLGPNSGALTTVSTVDPVKAYFTVSEQEYLAYIRRYPQRAADPDRTQELELLLADGTTYPRKGHIFVADRQVDPKTGTIRIAGLFPNPGYTLRPGQYARVRTVNDIKSGALLVPQRAVNELQGSYQVAVVGADNKISMRLVKVGDRVGSMWVIEDGVRPGERVVAEGTQKVGPDMVVNPRLMATPSESKKD